jgi:hypothetical protein
MKTALLITGQYRTFDIMCKYINNKLVIPNDAIVFIYAEHFNYKDFENKFNKNNIGIIKVLPSCKTEEYNKIFKKNINNDIKDFTFDEQDLFLIRFKK